MGLFDKELDKDIDKYLEYKEYLIEECKRYVQNTSIDLDKRWNFFTHKAIGKSKNGWIWHPNQEPVRKWLDDMLDGDMYRKYETIHVASIAQDDYGDGEINKPLYDQIRECILEEYIESFQFDW